MFEKSYEKDVGYDNEFTIKYNIDNIFDYKFECDTEINASDLGIEELDKNLYSIILFRHEKIKIIIIGVDNKILTDYVMSENIDKIPNLSFLFELCKFHINYESYSHNIKLDRINENVFNINEKINEIDTTKLTDKIIKQPIECKEKLFNYQKKSIYWMLDKEINKFSYYSRGIGSICFGNVLYNNEQFTLCPDKNKVIFLGGLLADVVGSGKTYEILTLSVLNPRINVQYIQQGLRRLCSRATLIICPNHICCQWKAEIIKMLNKTFNVVCLFTLTHYKKITYQDLLDADFVIISNKFIYNKLFLKDCFGEFEKKNSVLFTYYNPEVLESKINNYFDMIEYDIKKIFEKKPNIFIINWHRVVIDEFHEIDLDAKYNLILSISGNNKWCLTGTPINNFEPLLKFIIKENFILDIGIKNCIEKHSIFRRTVDIKKEFNLKPIKETIIWINLSQYERIIYNSMVLNGYEDSKTLMQMCCNLKTVDGLVKLINDYKTIDEVDNEVAKYYEKQIKNFQIQINKKNKKISILKEKLKQPKELTSSDIKLINEHIDKYECKIKLIEIELNGKKTSLNYFTKTIENVRNKSNDDNENTCPICLDVINNNSMSMLICGHIYCSKCINIYMKNNNKCPLCMKTINENDVYRIGAKIKDSSEKLDDDEKLIKTIGTKLSNLIWFIKKDTKKRIIFSQWNHLLHQVGQILNDSNIKNVFCQGNIWVKNKAIRDFMDNDDINIIMMSSEYTITGTTLTNAEQIIFLDPVYGSDENIINTEWQAIGRAYRIGLKYQLEIVRFLVKDSIEEELFNKRSKK